MVLGVIDGPEEAPEGPGDAGPVCDALGDDGCRRILERLDSPQSASELSDACDVPLSTTYRKLETLTDVGLVNEGTRIDDGQHVTTYHLGFDAVVVEHSDGRLVVHVDRLSLGPEERLADLWAEVRSEA